MTAKLMLVFCAHCWAAFKIWFCHVAADPNLALKVANKLLVFPFTLVPSGKKLSVISCGAGQALPLTEYGITRASRASTARRTPREGLLECRLIFFLNQLKVLMLFLGSGMPAVDTSLGTCHTQVAQWTC